MVANTSARVWQLPPSIADDLAAFEKNVAAFKAGAMSPTQFLVFRVPQGVYEQREAGTYMLRVRFPAGVVLSHQLRRLADIAEAHGDGVLHVTTRQDIQIHRVGIDAIHPALTSLAEAGLSTKGGGGNTVRNITGCPHSGICPDQAFDVTPNVIALTEFLLPDPKSFQLPRKLKVAFAGCSRDCSGATVSDVGLVAKILGGVKGFSVYVAGGLGSVSRVADLLEEFVAEQEVPLVVEAIKRVFDAHGNRRDKRQARLRFLVRQIGLEAFRKLYREQLTLLRREHPTPPAIRESSHVIVSNRAAGDSQPPAAIEGGYARWLKNNVKLQRQPSFVRVEIPLLLGDIASDRLRALASIVERHGEQMLRATQRQNLTLRWVGQDELPPLYAQLNAIGLAESPPPVLRDMVACTGAATCKLGICLSRGVARSINDTLSQEVASLDQVGELQLNISGCPNACGRHPVADVGLHGAARRVDGRLVPYYTVLLGGRTGEGATTLASGRHTVPAKNVPAFLRDLLDAFARSDARPDFAAFLRTHAALIDNLAERHKAVPAFSSDKSFYYDFGADQPFSLAGRGPGECGAGVYDLIEVDLKSATEALAQHKWFNAAALAARALLVTRGEQAGSDVEAFTLFEKHFVEAGLIDAKYRSLTQAAVAAARSGAATTFDRAQGPGSDVVEFVSAVQALFKNMDATLHFKPAAAATCSTPLVSSATAAPRADMEKDFRGVVCPLNYVKTKMALERLKPGQTLAVLLDSEGARNVPESATKDGHTVVAVLEEGSAARVFIRKRV